jgi:hypothetical protein
MGNGFDCEDCGHLVAGGDRAACLEAVESHEIETGHTMSEMKLDY